MREPSPEIIEAAKKIKLIAFDIDGVLTDGRITYSSSGEELKSFNVRDGHAIKMASRAGLQVAVITGRESVMVVRRCEELGITLLFQGIKDKMTSLDTILAKTGFEPEEVAYMGDDVVDLPLMYSVGIGSCPSDAADEVRSRSALVVKASGGAGAARELIFLILQAKGLLDGLMERYTLS